MRISKNEFSKCAENHLEYKLCKDDQCVPRHEPCPCGDDEFQCLDYSCIPRTFLCNGRLDCPDRADEFQCNADTQRRDIPLHVILGVTGACIVMVTILSVTLFYYWKRRQRLQKRSQSGNEPLKQDSDSTVETQKPIPLDAHPLMQTDVKRYPTEEVQVHSFVSLQHQTCQSNKVYNMLSSMDIDFGEGLLCTSTPKQGVKQFRKVHTLPNASPIKDTSKGDLSKNLNMSLFLPIT